MSRAKRGRESTAGWEVLGSSPTVGVSVSTFSSSWVPTAGMTVLPSLWPLDRGLWLAYFHDPIWFSVFVFFCLCVLKAAWQQPVSWDFRIDLSKQWQRFTVGQSLRSSLKNLKTILFYFIFKKNCKIKYLIFKFNLCNLCTFFFAPM